MLPQPCLRLQCDLILFLTMTHTCYRSCRGHGSSRAKSAAKSQSWVGADREQEKRAYGVPAACQPQLSRWMSRVRHPRHPVWRHRVLPLQRWRRRSHCRKKWVGGSGSGAWKTTLPQTQNPVLVRGLSWHFVLSLRSGSPVLAETSQGAPRKGSGSG